MTRKKPSTPVAASTAHDRDAKHQAGKLRHLGGSQSDHWNEELIRQAAGSVWLHQKNPSEIADRSDATAAALASIAPNGVLEGMMAAQLLAAHNAAMECYRRAMHPDQGFEARRESLNQASKLTRAWATLLEALNKHRGKGQQKVTVEHVHVHAGGQAVVGTVERPGGGDQSRLEERPHAKQIAHAPEPTLRGADPQERPVPVPRDGERALPDARRKVSGRADRK